MINDKTIDPKRWAKQLGRGLEPKRHDRQRRVRAHDSRLWSSPQTTIASETNIKSRLLWQLYWCLMSFSGQNSDEYKSDYIERLIQSETAIKILSQNILCFRLIRNNGSEYVANQYSLSTVCPHEFKLSADTSHTGYRSPVPAGHVFWRYVWPRLNCNPIQQRIDGLSDMANGGRLDKIPLWLKIFDKPLPIEMNWTSICSRQWVTMREHKAERPPQR